MSDKSKTQVSQKAAAQPAPADTPAVIEEEKAPQRFTIFCGTYEGAVLGLVGDLSKLDLKYAFKPSTNSLKCMEVSGKYLLVGGFDEYLRIYDLKRQRECGILDSHVGTITNIKHHKSIVFSCAEDGLIKAWKMKEFGLLHTLKEHKAAVNDIAVHKSGRILVSVSKDQRLIIWNLLNAKKVFSMNLKYNPYKVEMTEKNILTMSDYEIHVIDLESNQEIAVLKDDKQITLNDFQIFKEHYVVVGDNNGFVKIWDIRTKQNVSFKAHQTRVKKLQICEVDGIDIIVTISTSGEIHIFDALIILKEIESITESKELKDLQPIYHVDTLNRLTTLSVYLGAAAEKEDQEEEEDIEELEKIKLKEEQEKEKKKKQNNKHNKNKGKQVKVTISRDGEEGTTSSKSFIVDKNSAAKRNKLILKKQKKLEKKKLEKEAAKNGVNQANDTSKGAQQKEQSQGKQGNNQNKGEKQQKPQQKDGKQNQQQQKNNKANKAQKEEIVKKNGKKIEEEKAVNVPEKTKKIKKSVRFE